jgi:hypothetical protein
MKSTVRDMPCGYITTITVEKDDKIVSVTIQSECPAVEKLGNELDRLTVEDILAKFIENPVYQEASRFLRHSTCVIPWMILKMAEIEYGLNTDKLFSIEIEE